MLGDLNTDPGGLRTFFPVSTMTSSEGETEEEGTSDSGDRGGETVRTPPATRRNDGVEIGKSKGAGSSQHLFPIDPAYEDTDAKQGLLPTGKR